MDRRINTRWEEREEARLEATRKRNEELRERLLNPKVRITGRDESALALQIEEKKRQKEMEREEDRQYAQYLEQVNNKLMEEELNAKERQQAHNRTKYLEEWEREAERKRHEREQAVADYHRPEAMVGVSSAQVLEGEDPCAAKRKLLQQQQMRRWVQQQADERQRRQLEEKLEDVQHAEALRKLNQECDSAEHQAHQEKLQREREVQEYNKLMAAQAKSRKSFDSTVDAKLMDMEGGFMTGQEADKSVGKSVVNPHRFRPDHFKGLDAAALEAIRAEQQRQILEKRQRLEIEQKEERLLASQQRELLQVASHMSYEEQHAREAQRRANAEYLVQQRAEAEARRERARHHRAVEPAFTDDFFKGFGKSHR